MRSSWSESGPTRGTGQESARGLDAPLLLLTLAICFSRTRGPGGVANLHGRLSFSFFGPNADTAAAGRAGAAGPYVVCRTAGGREKEVVCAKRLSDRPTLTRCHGVHPCMDFPNAEG